MFSTQYDEQEIEAVQRVIKSGMLSGYIAGSLTGGPEVEALEREWEQYFKVKHAIAVNSATSGLYVAGGLLDDSIGIPALTMSASKYAFYENYWAIVDTDIEDDFYCIKDFKYPYTVAVDLFGQPYDVERSKGFIIEDAAQAIGAKYKDKYCGTLGDIGVFSLNHHKHITCGEGGVVVTDDDELARKIRLLRNHGEVVDDEINGLNLRMTELQAAVARVQLTKLEGFLKERLDRINFLNENIVGVYPEAIPKVRKDCTHVYYLYPARIREKKVELLRALEKRNVAYIDGYTEPLASFPVVDKVHKELVCFSIKQDTPYMTIENIILSFEEVYG
jgi:dTDP-4-amino-4,6-dideoxygalactose transaminase